MSSDCAFSEDTDYLEQTKSRTTRPKKRRKLTKSKKTAKATDTVEDGAAADFTFPTETLSRLLRNVGNEISFEDFIQSWLPDFMLQRHSQELERAEYDRTGQRMRPLRLHETSSRKQRLDHLSSEKQSPFVALLRRKLQIQGSPQRLKLPRWATETPDEGVNPLSSPVNPVSDPDILDALYANRSTPFHRSFLARIQGNQHEFPPGLMAIDWETRTPWMDLVEDIREHYSLVHPDRDQPKEVTAPLTYTTLHAFQLDQVHDLLERSFWPEINVCDSLDHQPEKATVVVMYKRIVVGVAILKSPIETYIMYLAVKAGWDRSQIARTMLYHLIRMNPGKDISLHVSTNNPAMLLYNQFGFKAEEFVAGFYAKYQDPRSTLSNNAFKFRLRHLPL